MTDGGTERVRGEGEYESDTPKDVKMEGKTRGQTRDGERERDVSEGGERGDEVMIHPLILDAAINLTS